MGKTTILQVIGGMDRGGAETFLMNVLRSIDKDKFQFVFLCYGDKPFDYEAEVVSLGAKLVRIPDVKTVGIRRHLQDIRRVIKENNIDGVHAHTYYNSVFSLFVASTAGLKLRAVHSHNTMAGKNPSMLKRLYFLISKIGITLFANTFLACGDDAGRALYLPIRRFSVIHNGINVEDFAFSKDARDKVRKGLGLNDSTTVIMHVGRFDEQKNHPFLIDVFNDFLLLNPNSVLLLIGDGLLRRSIEKKVVSLGIEDKVKFMGKRSDVYRFYSAADAFVMPSLYEGLPVVLIEAQVNGIPSLVSNRTRFWKTRSS